MNVYTVVPVAPFEPESIITRSIECLQELEHGDFGFEVYYIIDTFSGDTRDLHWELPDNFKVVLRTNGRGYRAGKINDFLKMIEDADYPADYVAIIDVDCRPAKDFIPKCIAALEDDDSAIFSSGCRLVNNKSNILTKLIAVEWGLICDVLLSTSGSKDFRNLDGVGVLKGSLLKGERFDERATCDDIDLLIRMYLKGKVAVLAETSFEDQVPSTFGEFYRQRVRWCRAFAESFSKYLIPMVRAPAPFTGKISWLLEVLGYFFAPFLSPVGLPWFLTSQNRKKLSEGPLESAKLLVGGVGYTWLMTIIGIVAIIQYLTSSKFEWRSTSRCDM
jgi:cellulose synthase/poly-beta-1,6-N-acetylglucosamine synthase-like glycosyltransferase